MNKQTIIFWFMIAISKIFKPILFFLGGKK